MGVLLLSEIRRVYRSPRFLIFTVPDSRWCTSF